MNAEFVIPFLVMLLAGGIASLLCFHLWRWRKEKGGFYFFLLMGAVAIFAFTGAGELAAATIEAKILWSKISYLGIVSVSPLWFLFAASYSHHVEWLERRRVIAIAIIPALTLVLAFTNQWHGLLWPAVTPVSSLPGARAIYSHGPAFWLHVGYAYLVLLLGTIWLLQGTWKSPSLFRWQAYSLIVAALIPWIANFLYIFNLNPWPGLELTPISLAMTGTIVFWSLFRNQMIDLVPVAREVIFESLADGVFVLDPKDRIVDINSTARSWLSIDESIIGQDIFELLKPYQVLQQYIATDQVKTQVEIVSNGQRSRYDLRISPLFSDHGISLGRVAWLHDITEGYVLLEAEKRRARQMKTLNAITLAALSEPELKLVYQVLAENLGELFDASGAYLTLWDPVRNTAIPTAAYGPFKATYPDFEVELDEKTLSEAVLATGKVLVIENVFETDYVSPRIVASFPAHSMLVLPLIADGKKLGAALISYNSYHHFEPEEIYLGELASAQLALAIAKAQLVESERQQRELAEGLRQVSQALTESLDFETVLDRVLVEIKRVIPYDFACIILRDDSGHRARIIRWTGYDRFGEEIDQQIARLEFEIAETANLRQMVASKKPLIIADIAQDPNWVQTGNRALKGSWIGAPIIVKGRVSAFLSLDKDEPNFYRPDLAQRLEAFANQSAIAFENARLYAEVRELSILDELTGVYNRRGFNELGRRELERAVRHRIPVSAIFIDVDNFKSFNDRYSYAVGDRVLQLLAGTLKSNLREVDVIGRYGGEEFIVLSSDTSLLEATTLAERLRKLVEGLRLDTEYGDLSITVSIGVSQMPLKEPKSLAELVECAGQAVHLAKVQGKNRVYVS